jgi:NTE family protein
MRVPPVSVRFTDRLIGGGGVFDFTVQIPVDGPVDGPVDEATVVGSIQLDGWDEPAYLAGGVVTLEAGSLTYRGSVRLGGADVLVACTRDLVDDPGWDDWDDLTRARVRVGEVVFEASLGIGGAARLVASAEPVGAHGVIERTRAVHRFWERVRAARRVA